VGHTLLADRSEFAAFVIYDFEEDEIVSLIQQMIAEGENEFA